MNKPITEQEFTQMSREEIFKLLEKNDKEAISVIDSKLQQRFLWLGSKTNLKFIRAIFQEASANTKFTFALYFQLQSMQKHLRLLTDAILTMSELQRRGEAVDLQQIVEQIKDLKEQNEENQEVIDIFKEAFRRRYFCSKK